MIVNYEQEEIPEIRAVGDAQNFRVFAHDIWKALKGCMENDLLCLPDLQCYLPAKNLHKLVMMEYRNNPAFDIHNAENSLKIEYIDSLGVKIQFSLNKVNPSKFRDTKQVRVFMAIMPGLAIVEQTPEPVNVVEIIPEPATVIPKPRKPRKTAVPVLPLRNMYPITGKFRDRIIDQIDYWLYSIEIKLPGATA